MIQKLRRIKHKKCTSVWVKTEGKKAHGLREHSQIENNQNARTCITSKKSNTTNVGRRLEVEINNV